jgi:hypothetical protein
MGAASKRNCEDGDLLMENSLSKVHEAGHDHATTYNALGCCGWQCFCCFCRW